MRNRSAHVLAAAVLTALALTGCSDDDGSGDTASDPAGETPSDTPSEPIPSASPTVGTYPDFEPTDYAFTLRVTCFCPDAGVPVRVTVVDDAVASAVYAKGTDGFDKGATAPDYRALTIDDIIDEVNAATGAESVQVEWPEGQDYPSEVSIDQSSQIADEEIGYRISDVEAG